MEWRAASQSTICTFMFLEVGSSTGLLAKTEQFVSWEKVFTWKTKICYLLLFHGFVLDFALRAFNYFCSVLLPLPLHKLMHKSYLMSICTSIFLLKSLEPNPNFNFRACGRGGPLSPQWPDSL